MYGLPAKDQVVSVVIALFTVVSAQLGRTMMVIINPNRAQKQITGRKSMNLMGILRAQLQGYGPIGPVQRMVAILFNNMG